jgi:DUF4097 and DUF4098 domain-containing protein YvlB
MRKSSFITLSFVLTAMGFYAEAAVAAPPIIYQKAQSLPAQSGGAVRLRLGSQDVAITTHPQRTVKVTVTIRSNANSKDEKRKIIKKLVPTIEAQGKNVVIQSRHNEDNGGWFNFSGFGSHNVNAKVAVVMPAAMSVNFKLGSGDFAFDGASAHTKITGDAGSGDVHIHSASAQLDIDTGSGDQHIQLAQSAGKAALRASSGDITFSGGAQRISIDTGSGDIDASGRSGRARLQAGSGDIEISDLTASLRAETGSGDITARWTRLGPQARISAEAGSGDVELVLPADAKLRGALVTDGGDIDSDFPGASHDHGRRFELTGGQSAIPVHVQTGSGEIDLEKHS